MNCTKVSIFKQSNQVSFGCLLQSQDCVTLEPKISLEVLCNFTDQPLEWELPDQQLSTLLVLANFTVPFNFTWVLGQKFLKLRFNYERQSDFRPCRDIKKNYFTYRRATVPGRYLWGFLTPPVVGADFRAALVANCFLGALPPVDLRAVCFVRAIWYIIDVY